ncbi:2OG-Fe(II) oxygenase [Parasphingorhabdus cellanae]|uniref:2OG-Fe(II) oxygenase n=2 Tax=Parasphingorhabdus cellanae TaxID=2806553 RepID=A0ABX7TA77_9SPHN|nr:2OG-Fe(II) oxygenase [Parasphingorhabdus cellanae]
MKTVPKTKATKYNSPKRMIELSRRVTDKLNAHPHVQWLESPHAQLFVHQNFLSDADCALLIDMIEADSAPSSVYETMKSEDFRTSYSCNVKIDDPDIQRIEKSIADLMGLDNDHSEVLQGQRYEVGQEFKDHHDFFHESEQYWKNEQPNGGQRSWTAMAYLNEPEEGGATAFPNLDYQVKPRKGMLLIWNNMGLDGRPNLNTLHAGTPVVKGTKYIITKWFRLNRWHGRPVTITV